MALTSNVIAANFLDLTERTREDVSIFHELTFSLSIDVTKGNGHYPKVPIVSPRVYQNNHILYLIYGCDNTTIVLYNEEGDEIISTYVIEGTDILTIDEDLNGMYYLEIIRGDFHFTTFINL